MVAIITGCGCWQLVADQPNETIATQNYSPLLQQSGYYTTAQQSAALPNGIRESELPTVTPDGTTRLTGITTVNGQEQNVNVLVSSLAGNAVGGYEWTSDNSGAFVLPTGLPVPKTLSYGGSTFTRSQFGYNSGTRIVTLNPDFTLDAGQIAVVDF